MKCPTCGYDWCDGVMYMQTDPFALEIYDDETEYEMCQGMAYDSAQDI